MEKIAKILALLAVVIMITGCKKLPEFNDGNSSDGDGGSSFSELIVGRWKTSDGGHYEVYNSDGTGKMWDPADDVQEDEADHFDWTMDEANKQLTQIVHSQGGQGDVPQLCNILILNETTLKYNNDALKREVTLTRVQQ